MPQPPVIWTWRSVWQTPLAVRRTRISSSRRSSKAIGSTATLSPAAFSIAPRSLTARGYACGRFYRTVVWYIVPARGTGGAERGRADPRAAAAASLGRAREIYPRSGAPHLPPEGLPRSLDAEHRGCRGPLQGQPVLLRFVEGGATRSTVRRASGSGPRRATSDHLRDRHLHRAATRNGARVRARRSEESRFGSRVPP